MFTTLMLKLGRGVVVFLLVVAALALVSYLALDAYVRSELAAAIAETDKLDPRWRLKDIEADRQKIPEAENSALQVAKAAQLLPKREIGVPINPDFWAIAKGLEPNARLNEQQRAYLRDWLETRDKALAEARKLETMPRGNTPGSCWDEFPKFSSPGDDTLKLRELLTYACLHLADTDVDDAMRVQRAQINNARALGDHASLIAVLFRCAAARQSTDTLERILPRERRRRRNCAARKRCSNSKCANSPANRASVGSVLARLMAPRCC